MNLKGKVKKGEYKITVGELKAILDDYVDDLSLRKRLDMTMMKK